MVVVHQVFIMRITENLSKNFPWITVLTYVEKEYVGVVINQDSQVTIFYDWEMIKDQVQRERFIEMAEVWWWESNRQIPVNVFMFKESQEFKPAIKILATKDVKIDLGPCMRLDQIITKRIKRRSITLVRKIS
jgi:hypothetical protein